MDGIAQLIAAAKELRPGLCIDAEAFSEYLKAKLSKAECERPERLHVDDLWLAYACLQGDVTAQRELVAIVRGVTEKLAPGLSIDAGAELCSQVLELLLVAPPNSQSRLTRYSGEGSLVSWLWAVCAREAGRLESKRVKDRRFEEDVQAALVITPDDPELGHIQKECLSAFRNAFDLVVRRLGQSDRFLLRMWIREGLTLNEIASTMQLGRRTVIRRLQEIRSSLLKGTLLEMGRTLALNRDEVESLMRVLDSRLEASLTDVLASDGPDHS